MEQDGTRWKKMLLSPARGGRRGGGVGGGHVAVAAVLVDLKISQIEKNVSLDHTRPCIDTIHIKI